MWRFVRGGSLVAVCFLFFSPSLPADGVHSFTDRADAFSDKFTDFTSTDPASVGGDPAFFLFRTLGSTDDSEDVQGEAWRLRNDRHHHHLDGESGWSFADQDKDDIDGDGGNTQSPGNGDPPTFGVPEPSVLVLLSTALAVFLLKSLWRTMA